MRTLIFGFLAGALILMLCISGCTTSTTQPPVTEQPTIQTTQLPQTTQPLETVPQTLIGVIWYLIAFNEGGFSLSIKPGTEITAFFDTQGKVNGSAGCNQYTATYEVTMNGLSIGAPATTKKSCDEPAGIMTQETVYLTTIQGASSYSISGNTLTINDSAGKAILIYSSVPPYEMTPVPLTDTTFYLNSIIDATGQIWTPITGSPLSLQFTSGGNVSGNSGCNSYSGSYSVTDSSINISGFAVTRMYCEPKVMELETTYLAALPTMTRYMITGNELMLSDGTGKITMLYNTNPM